MPPLRYWIMRTLRRNTPQRLVDMMLDRGVYLKAGRDTSAPQESVRAYEEAANRHGLSLAGSRICVVGAGGGFGIGIYLLEAGASQVILQEPFAPSRPWRNRSLISEELLSKYLVPSNGSWQPRDERILPVRERLEVLAGREPASFDLIVSNSVLEHVTDVELLIASAARLLKPEGLTVHFVDLRDHYFRYPFEMLCYREATWQRWLNASNTLNRWRLPAYREVFERHFAESHIEILESLPEEFERRKGRIRPEHLTGDDEIDAAAIIRVEGRRPAIRREANP